MGRGTGSLPLLPLWSERCCLANKIILLSGPVSFWGGSTLKGSATGNPVAPRAAGERLSLAKELPNQTPFHDFPKQKFIRLRKIVPFALPMLIAGPAITVVLVSYFLSMAHMQSMSYDALRNGSGKVMDKLVVFLPMVWGNF